MGMRSILSSVLVSLFAIWEPSVTLAQELDAEWVKEKWKRKSPSAVRGVGDSEWEIDVKVMAL